MPDMLARVIGGIPVTQIYPSTRALTRHAYFNTTRISQRGLPIGARLLYERLSTGLHREEVTPMNLI